MNADAFFVATEEARLYAHHMLRIYNNPRGEEKISLRPAAGGEGFRSGLSFSHNQDLFLAGRAARATAPTHAESLNPLQCALLPYPDVTDDENQQEDQHFGQAKGAQCLEFHCPGKQEDGFHIENNK